MCHRHAQVKPSIDSNLSFPLWIGNVRSTFSTCVCFLQVPLTASSCTGCSQVPSTWAKWSSRRSTRRNSGTTTICLRKHLIRVALPRLILNTFLNKNRRIVITTLVFLLCCVIRFKGQYQYNFTDHQYQRWLLLVCSVWVLEQTF